MWFDFHKDDLLSCTSTNLYVSIGAFDGNHEVVFMETRIFTQGAGGDAAIFAKQRQLVGMLRA